ncbi:MAG: OmpA family protein [Candidatus Wallbacteria bacterium]
MAKKQEQEKEMNFEAWLLPYSDMMTLLVAFFIIMYALGISEKEKSKQVLENISEAFGVPGLSNNGGEKFKNPMTAPLPGTIRKGTNKKVKYTEDTGKNPTVGNILNLLAPNTTAEAEYLGTNQELINKFKAFSESKLAEKKAKIQPGGLSITINETSKTTGEINFNEEKGGSEGSDADNYGAGNTGDKSGIKDPYLSTMISKMSSVFPEEIQKGSLEIKLTERGIEMILQSEVMFELGSAELLPESLFTLQKISAILKALANMGFNFRVEGHTDNINVHSFLYPSNWELSCARAVSVVRYMVEEMDLLPNTIAASGYGRFRPIADNSTVAGRKKNRRIEILIYDPSKTLNYSDIATNKGTGKNSKWQKNPTPEVPAQPAAENNKIKPANETKKETQNKGKN